MTTIYRIVWHDPNLLTYTYPRPSRVFVALNRWTAEAKARALAESDGCGYWPEITPIETPLSPQQLVELWQQLEAAQPEPRP